MQDTHLKFYPQADYLLQNENGAKFRLQFKMAPLQKSIDQS